jgi:hypothetical protein
MVVDQGGAGHKGDPKQKRQYGGQHSTPKQARRQNGQVQTSGQHPIVSTGKLSDHHCLCRFHAATLPNCGRKATGPLMRAGFVGLGAPSSSYEGGCWRAPWPSRTPFDQPGSYDHRPAKSGPRTSLGRRAGRAGTCWLHQECERPCGRCTSSKR